MVFQLYLCDNLRDFVGPNITMDEDLACMTLPWRYRASCAEKIKTVQLPPRAKDDCLLRPSSSKPLWSRNSCLHGRLDTKCSRKDVSDCMQWSARAQYDKVPCIQCSVNFCCWGPTACNEFTRVGTLVKPGVRTTMVVLVVDFAWCLLFTIRSIGLRYVMQITEFYVCTAIVQSFAFSYADGGRGHAPLIYFICNVFWKFHIAYILWCVWYHLEICPIFLWAILYTHTKISYTRKHICISRISSFFSIKWCSMFHAVLTAAVLSRHRLINSYTETVTMPLPNMLNMRARFPSKMLLGQLREQIGDNLGQANILWHSCFLTLYRWIR